jgi:hypothetical protein
MEQWKIHKCLTAFNQDNTVGYSDDELLQMNKSLLELMSLEINGSMDDDEFKEIFHYNAELILRSSS